MPQGLPIHLQRCQCQWTWYGWPWLAAHGYRGQGLLRTLMLDCRRRFFEVCSGYSFIVCYFLWGHLLKWSIFGKIAVQNVLNLSIKYETPLGFVSLIVFNIALIFFSDQWSQMQHRIIADISRRRKSTVSSGPIKWIIEWDKWRGGRLRFWFSWKFPIV